MVKRLPSGMTKTEEGLLEVMWFLYKWNESSQVSLASRPKTLYTTYSCFHQKQDVSVQQILKRAILGCIPRYTYLYASYCYFIEKQN